VADKKTVKENMWPSRSKSPNQLLSWTWLVGLRGDPQRRDNYGWPV